MYVTMMQRMTKVAEVVKYLALGTVKYFVGVEIQCNTQRPVILVR
jgi:hypothetical protein